MFPIDMILKKKHLVLASFLNNTNFLWLKGKNVS